MASMTESQFATFRADVQRTAREEVRKTSDEIRANIYQAVVNEARSVAAATARKDLERMKTENQELRVAVRGLSKQVDGLLNRVAVLEDSRMVESTVGHSIKVDEFRIVGWEPAKPKDGDTLNRGGEKFTFWWGAWRRQSELEGFATWMARKAAQ